MAPYFGYTFTCILHPEKQEAVIVEAANEPEASTLIKDKTPICREMTRIITPKDDIRESCGLTMRLLALEGPLKRENRG